MLDPVNWWEGEEHFQVGSRVRYSDRLAGAFTARMRQLETTHRWLAGFFQAAAIIIQLPGGADYRCDQDRDDDPGDQADDPAFDLIWKADHDTLLSILAECFGRLGAEEVMGQVPGGMDYRQRELPVPFRLMLAERDGNGLLNVVAECLDRLLVIPALPEEERSLYDCAEAPRRSRPSSWWRRLSPASLARRLRRRR